MKRTTMATASAAALIVALSGCSSSDSAPAGAETTATSTAPSSPRASASPTASDTVVIKTAVVDGKVDPAPSRVKVAEGQKVKLTVTRDTAGEVHVHGYELEKDAQAGKPVTFTFVADQTGLFEVEAHDPDLLLLQLQVQ